jgi:hypothetical protein
VPAKLLTTALVLAVSAQSPWTKWKTGLDSACPRSHFEWVGDGGFDELLADFTATLSEAEQRKVARLVDYERNCAAEQMGFSCEMAYQLLAFGNGKVSTAVSTPAAGTPARPLPPTPSLLRCGTRFEPML